MFFFLKINIIHLLITNINLYNNYTLKKKPFNINPFYNLGLLLLNYRIPYFEYTN